MPRTSTSDFNAASASSFFDSLANAFNAAAMERITLLLNHVIASEPVATDRLRPHAGKTIELLCANWPSLLPAPPVMAFAVTPAGLLEWRGDSPPKEALPAQPDLRVSLDVANPLRLMGQWFAGERPAVVIEGDSALASDVNWLIDNLRWDIEDDLARIVGQGPAHQIAKGASFVANGFRDAFRALQDLVDRASK